MTYSRKSRAMMGIADAAVSSGGNLILAILAASSMTPKQFGLFAASLAALIFLTGVVRSGLVDPYTLIYSGLSAETRRMARSSMLGASLTVALIFSLPIALTAFGYGLDTETGILVLACGLGYPLLLLQDVYRWSCYADGRYEYALLNTSIWTALTLLFVILVQKISDLQTSPLILVAGWSASAGIAAGLMALIVRTPLRVKDSPSWLVTARPIGSRTIVDFALTQSLSNGTLFVVAIVAGPAMTATLRVAQLPFAATQVVITGLVSFLQPLMVTSIRAKADRRAFSTAILSFALLCVTLIVLTAIVITVPERYMVEILGESWLAAEQYTWLVALGLVGSSLAAAFGPLLRALGGLNYEVKMKLMLIPAVFLLVIICATMDSVRLVIGVQAAGAILMGGLVAFASCKRARRATTQSEIDSA